MPERKIVLVDDESELVQLLQIELEMGGYRVSAAYDGEAGLRLVRETRPDLVLLDVMMPGLDGYQVLKSIKDDPAIKDTCVIMLTAKGLEGEIQKGLDLGADDYIAKPFHSELLIKKVKRFLE